MKYLLILFSLLLLACGSSSFQASCETPPIFTLTFTNTRNQPFDFYIRGNPLNDSLDRLAFQQTLSTFEHYHTVYDSTNFFWLAQSESISQSIIGKTNPRACADTTFTDIQDQLKPIYFHNRSEDSVTLVIEGVQIRKLTQGLHRFDMASPYLNWQSFDGTYQTAKGQIRAEDTVEIFADPRLELIGTYNLNCECYDWDPNNGNYNYSFPQFEASCSLSQLAFDQLSFFVPTLFEGEARLLEDFSFLGLNAAPANTFTGYFSLPDQTIFIRKSGGGLGGGSVCECEGVKE